MAKNRKVRDKTRHKSYVCVQMQEENTKEHGQKGEKVLHPQHSEGTRLYNYLDSSPHRLTHKTTQ